MNTGLERIKQWRERDLAQIRELEALPDSEPKRQLLKILASQVAEYDAFIARH